MTIWVGILNMIKKYDLVENHDDDTTKYWTLGAVEHFFIVKWLQCCSM